MTDCKQYLKDIGCPKDLETEYLELASQHKTEEQILFLRRLRNSIMDDLHECNKKVDCIDFIIQELSVELMHRNK